MLLVLELLILLLLLFLSFYVLFLIFDFFWCIHFIRYYLSQSLKAAFETAPADPTVDLNMQL